MNRIKTYKLFKESIGSPLLSLKDNTDSDLLNIIEDKVELGGRILEISCGNGADSLYLKELGYDVTCTEFNQDYVDNAVKIGLNCIQHDTRNKFKFNDKEFDLVYSRLGLHYFSEDELDGILTELNRISSNLLITVKIVDDIKTGKVIFTPDIWKSLIDKFFDIEIFEIKEGILYDNQSKWIKIFAKSK